MLYQQSFQTFVDDDQEENVGITIAEMFIYFYLIILLLSVICSLVSKRKRTIHYYRFKFQL